MSLLLCRESIQGSLESLYQTSQYQANRVGSNIYQGYGYVQDGLVSGSGRYNHILLCQVMEHTSCLLRVSLRFLAHDRMDAKASRLVS